MVSHDTIPLIIYKSEGPNVKVRRQLLLFNKNKSFVYFIDTDYANHGTKLTM